MFAKEAQWVHCPICGSKTKTKIYEDTILIRFPLYCPVCKRETRIDAKVDKQKTSKPFGFEVFSGGVGGIRTLDTVLPYTRFPVVLVMTSSILLHEAAVGVVPDSSFIIHHKSENVKHEFQKNLKI